MKIIVTGLNHKRTPIQIREKLAFDSAQVLEALTQLKNRFIGSEFVLLSTCNRVELYCATKRNGGATPQDLAQFLSQFHNIDIEDFRDYLYVYNDTDAVRHLLTVASSLDSMVLGEAQIAGQVKESYKLACAAQSTGKILNRLFHCAFATSKSVYTNTQISNGRVSVAGVAVELAMQLFADIGSAKTLVVGAGEIAELLLQHLLHVGAKKITVINRSYENGLELANRYHVAAQEWEMLTEQLIDTDLVIASAGCWDFLFSKKMVEQAMRGRRSKPLLIIDIAVPRNFEPSVNEIEDVYLYSIDELSQVAEQNRRMREDDIAAGLAIIGKSADDFIEWFNARDLGPLIGQMKEKFVQIGQNELEQFLAENGQSALCNESAKMMVERIVNKMLHCVIENVNVVAKEQGPSEAAKLVESIVRGTEGISLEPPTKDESKAHTNPPQSI
jgi:glutamyl-tRNA reductase